MFETLLRYRLDAVAFAATCVLTLLLLDRGLRRHGGEGVSRGKYALILGLIIGGILAAEAAAWAHASVLRYTTAGRYDPHEWVWSGALHRVAVFLFVAFGIIGHVLGAIALRFQLDRLAQRTELAMHDRLTGLPNRTQLSERLTSAMQRAKNDDSYRYAVIFLDLDHFKLINDSLGHEVGDQLLVQVADRLRRAMPSERNRPFREAMPARLGGDEFVVFIDGIAGVADATGVARGIEAALADPFELAGREVRVTASIGITCSDPAYQQPGEILRDSDTAMYAAKQAGKNRCRTFDREMYNRALARLTAEQDLRKAVGTNQLRLVYQPVVSLQTGLVEGFEALVRWVHPQRGNVSPDQFIPLAEETGLIVPIGQWVLREAARTLARWSRNHPQAGTYLAVNVSRRQMSETDWIGNVRRAIEEHGLDPSRLRLEITESSIMTEPEESVRALRRLREMGINIYLDDFGTGYSSLSCLHRFPLSALKLDRAFVASVSENREYTAIVSAIVSLAYHLEMQVIAEGIEREDQLVLLQSLGCHNGQGYFFAKPMEEHEAERMIREGWRSAGAALAA